MRRQIIFEIGKGGAEEMAEVLRIYISLAEYLGSVPQPASVGNYSSRELKHLGLH